jgi:hypothetical protein
MLYSRIDHLCFDNEELIHNITAQLYIYRVRLWCFVEHKTYHASHPYLEIESSND